MAFCLIMGFCLIMDFCLTMDFCLIIDFCLILGFCLIMDFCLIMGIRVAYARRFAPERQAEKTFLWVEQLLALLRWETLYTSMGPGRYKSFLVKVWAFFTILTSPPPCGPWFGSSILAGYLARLRCCDLFAPSQSCTFSQKSGSMIFAQKYLIFARNLWFPRENRDFPTKIMMFEQKSWCSRENNAFRAKILIFAQKSLIFVQK